MPADYFPFKAVSPWSGSQPGKSTEQFARKKLTNTCLVVTTHKVTINLPPPRKIISACFGPEQVCQWNEICPVIYNCNVMQGKV